MNGYANDNEAAPDDELERLFRYLDRTAVPLPNFGCYAAVAANASAIFVCPMRADGSPEMDSENANHMSWSQVSSPATDFAQTVNAVFHTEFRVSSLSRR